ncbi:MAG: hypothetical protein HGA96_12380 [Desulfobulbaceae bacterium]|nr:hypothetical protein [Desulfobulbaceae bacterium]
MKKQIFLLAGLMLVGLVILAGCATETNIPQTSAPGLLFTTAKGRVTRVNRSESWLELKPKGGAGKLVVNYDATTTLLNFKSMIEITKEQPVEVSYKLGGEAANQAISIRKLQPDECN